MRRSTVLFLLVFAFFMGIIATMEDIANNDDDNKSIDKLQANVTNVAKKVSKLEKKEVIDKVRKIISDIKSDYENSNLDEYQKSDFIKKNIDQLDKEITKDLETSKIRNTDTFSTIEKNIIEEESEVNNASKEISSSIKFKKDIEKEVLIKKDDTDLDNDKKGNSKNEKGFFSLLKKGSKNNTPKEDKEENLKEEIINDKEEKIDTTEISKEPIADILENNQDNKFIDNNINTDVDSENIISDVLENSKEEIIDNNGNIDTHLENTIDDDLYDLESNTQEIEDFSEIDEQIKKIIEEAKKLKSSESIVEDKVIDKDNSIEIKEDLDRDINLESKDNLNNDNTLETSEETKVLPVIKELTSNKEDVDKRDSVEIKEDLHREINVDSGETLKDDNTLEISKITKALPIIGVEDLDKENKNIEEADLVAKPQLGIEEILQETEPIKNVLIMKDDDLDDDTKSIDLKQSIKNDVKRIKKIEDNNEFNQNILDSKIDKNIIENDDFKNFDIISGEDIIAKANKAIEAADIIEKKFETGTFDAAKNDSEQFVNISQFAEGSFDFKDTRKKYYVDDKTVEEEYVFSDDFIGSGTNKKQPKPIYGSKESTDNKYESTEEMIKDYNDKLDSLSNKPKPKLKYEDSSTTIKSNISNEEKIDTNDNKSKSDSSKTSKKEKKLKSESSKVSKKDIVKKTKKTKKSTGK